MTDIRILRRALAYCGGREELAKELGVTLEDIGEWLAGVTIAPPDSYLAACELVAFSDGRRRVSAARRRPRPAI